MPLRRPRRPDRIVVLGVSRTAGMPGDEAKAAFVKILMVNYELPPLGGGAGKATLYLADHLARSGHEVVILTSHYRGLARREIRRGVRVLRVPVLRRHPDRCGPLELLSFVLVAAAAALWAGLAFRPDAVLAFFAFPSGPVARLMRLVFRTPYVVSLRGSDVPRTETSSGLSGVLLKIVMRHVCRHAADVTAVSEGLRQAALAAAPGLDVRVVPNGVDLDQFHPRPQPRTDACVNLLYVGRLRKFKGVGVLLSALAKAKAGSDVALSLSLVGDGPDRATLERQCRQLGLTDAVRFHGWVDYARVAEHYERADGLVLPSFVEGMPNVVLEAMACGLPVVGTDVAGTRELIRDGREGRLVPPRDAEALAAALLELAGDPARRLEMGRRGRERALEFSWEQTALQYADLLNRIASGDSP